MQRNRNNTMGRIRDLFKNIRLQGYISCKDGHNKGQKWQRPNRSKRDEKKWQYYKELYKTFLNDPDNHDGVVTHLEPGILEFEVNWALENITTNKADGIPVELVHPKR